MISWDEWRGAAAPELRRAVARIGGRTAARAAAAGRKTYREHAPVRTGRLRASVRYRIRRRGRGADMAWLVTVDVPRDWPYRWVLRGYPDVAQWRGRVADVWYRHGFDVVSDWERSMGG